MSWLPIVIAVLFSLSALVGLFSLTRTLLRWRWLTKRHTVYLEVTPPLSGKRSAQATEKLFAVLYGLALGRGLKDKLLDRPNLITCEIIASRDKGIRFLIGTEAKLADSLEQLIYSYLSAAKVTLYTDDQTLPTYTKVRAFKQQRHFAFPLASHDQLEEHDPLTYLTNAMANLEPGESIRLQYVLSAKQSKEAALLAHRILGNEDVVRQLAGRSLPFGGRLGGIVSGGLFGALDLMGEAYHGSTSSSYKTAQKSNSQKLDVAKHLRPARTLSAFELELMESMHRKLNQPLFSVSIRAAVTSQSKHVQKQRLNAIQTMLASYHTPGYQSIRKVRTVIKDKWQRRMFELQAPWHSSILSAAEIGSLFHFPLSNGTGVDNLSTSLSKSLAAPISLKAQTNLAVVIGQNLHHGTKTPIGLTEAERERHVYIIGGTGNGKTTMLQYAIVQDMAGGEGVAVVDPHGDMAETLLRHVPENRIKDVVYFNPDDLMYPIGMNLLELTPGLTGNELMREKDLITESVVSVFRKIFSEEDTGGHRIEYVLRNTVQTALTIPDSTLFTVFDLLNDPKYRKSIIKTLEDRNLINFWKNELGKAGDMQKVKMAAGITAKIGRFLFSASAKQILEQPRSTIDFDDIINSGKILICNFSKGLLGEDTSELFGITVLAKLQLASLRRARLRQQERRAFYLYVDEFQNFATQSFVQMLSESRKYKLFMTMAEQSTSQQKDQQMVSIILANVGTVICFRTGNPQDERVLLPLFTPFIEPGEINNLQTYNFYARLSGMKTQEPVSGQTLLLESEENNEIAEATIESSRATFAKKQDFSVPSEHTQIDSIVPKRQARKSVRPASAPMIDAPNGAS